MNNMETATLSGYTLAVRAERIDSDNWIDEFTHAPEHIARAFGLTTKRHGELAMVRSGIPFNHFNMVMTLGCPAKSDEQAFDAIEHFYAEGGNDQHWIVVNEFSQPNNLERQLEARGYELDGAWERVVMQGVPTDRWAQYAVGCEIVTQSTAEEWSGFIVDCYRMPALIGDWLKALVGKPGWTHAIRRERGQLEGKVVMARSIYQDGDGWAWLGIDAPVPGVMAQCFEEDQKIVATLIAHASIHGARAFVSDIEVPSPTRDSEAYVRWGQLGFEAVYLRKLYRSTRKR